MRLPCVRFTVRRMMVAVAVLGLTCLAGRESWAWWLRRPHPNPVSPSQVSATAGRGNKLTWSPGRSVPVDISYQFGFGNPMPAAGTTCLLFAQVWFEDVATGRSVDSYSFDAPLVVGGRETALGSLTWDAVLQHPGRYMLRSYLYYQKPSGELQMFTGGGHGYNVVEVDPSVRTSSRPGEAP